MKLFSIYIAILLLVVLSSCLEQFTPDIPDNSTSALVVDGIITDQPGPYTVKITTSAPLGEANADPPFVAGAVVTIEEENGIMEQLSEVEGGVYKTSSILGKVGKRYRLGISYQDQQYLSAWEMINASPVIDSVYFQIVTIGTTDKDDDLTGIQFYIDSHGSEEGPRNYRFEWVETWEIGVTYPSDYDYLGNDDIELTDTTLHTCWKWDSSVVINVITTAGLSENVLSGHSLTFITGEDERFTRRYSLLVRQYTLNDDEYFFWKLLQESSEQLGSLFDKQPATITGNISNISNPNDVVLGYFSASGLVEERIFIGEQNSLSRRLDCKIALDTLLKSELGPEYESGISKELNSGKFFFRFFSTPFEVLGTILSDPRCADCRLKGGDINKPDFWDE